MKLKLLLLSVLFCLNAQASVGDGDKPKYAIAGGIGYGYIVNRPADGVDEDIYDKLRKGLDWDISFNRYYKQGIGWGILYKDFRSSAHIFYGDLDDVNRFTYIAPQFSWIRSLGDKWTLHLEVGFGWLGFRETLQTSGFEVVAKSNTLGSHVGSGIGYRLSRKVVLDFNMSMVGGVFYDMDFDGNGSSFVIPDTDDDGWGAARINIGVGLRFFFGKNK